MLRPALWMLLAVPVTACVPSRPSSSTQDAAASGAEDATAADAHAPDALGFADAGGADDAALDASASPDASVSPDAVVLPDAAPVDAQLPDGQGWIPLPGTELASACPYDQDPTFSGVEGCSAIVEDWSGGIADTLRERLVVWGGGHNGYYGNELYALDLRTQSMQRLNDPSPPWADRNECSPVTANGDAASRHTYDGLAYIAHADKMFAFGGAPACGPGGLTNDTWTFDFATMRWESRDPHNGGTPGAHPGAVADYDAATQRVYLHDTYAFWSYDVDTNTYAQLRDHVSDGNSLDYHLTGRVDPTRRLFVILGNGEFHLIDLAPGSTYALQSPTLTGCDPVLSAIYPGLAYHPGLDRMVAWAGGDTLYLLDVDQRSCTTLTDGNGPGVQVANGTNGRFRYFPALGVFGLVNQWDQPGFIFRP